MIDPNKLYVQLYGCIDFENDVFNCVLMEDNLQAAIKSSVTLFKESAQECKLKNFNVTANRADSGDIIVSLLDSGTEIEWHTFKHVIPIEF